MSNQQPLIIKDFDQGIAQSPHKGFGLFRNADLESFPGAVKVGKKPGPYFHAIVEQAFTADASDLGTCAANIESNGANFTGAAVYFTTTGTLPAGLSINTVYYLSKISDTTFKVCLSYKNSVGSAAGTFVNITDAGTGVHTMHQLGIGTINYIIENPVSGYLWMLSSNGRVWFVPGGQRAYLLHNSAIESVAGSLTAASGQGLVLSPFSSTTKSYLFVFRNALIDVIDVFDNTAIEALGWSNAWQSMNSATGSTNSHHAIKGQDDAVYYCDDRYIGSIIENVGQTFDPANGATFTYNDQALDLPVYEIAQCLEELGTNLLIGGNTFNKIYPWDRISDSFAIPLTVPEYSIKRLKNIGDSVFILAGTWGNIYTTQGTYVKFFTKLPNYLTNNAGAIQTNPITWGGIAAVNGALLVGVSTVTSGNSGVWRIYPDGRITIDNVPSIGSANVIGLWAKNEFYVMGYAGGADTFNSALYSTLLYNSLETVIHSALYKVATKLTKGIFSRIEVVLAKPASGGSIKVGYRANLSATSFTNIDTFTADGATTIFTKEELGITDVDNIQLQVEMNDSNVGSVDVELLEIRLYP
jgi:hypothetical protein